MEATSGNKGISMVFMAAMKGYKHEPHYAVLHALGGEGEDGEHLAPIQSLPIQPKARDVKKAYELFESTLETFMLQPFSNPAKTQHSGSDQAPIFFDSL